MFKTDIHTVYLIVAINKFMLGFLMLHIRTLTSEGTGTRYWAFGNLITGFGLLITSFYDYPIPIWHEFLFSLILNILIFSGDIIFLFGIQRFKGKKLNHKLWILPFLSILNIVFFTLVYHNISIRLVINGLLAIVLYVASAAEFLDRSYKMFKSLFRICAVLFFIIAFVYLVRNVSVALIPINEPVTDNPASYILIGLAGICSTLLTYYLIIILTHKLTYELNSQIESKNKLYAIISHDLRGPAGNLSNYLEILKKSHTDWDSEKFSQWIGKVENIASGSRFLMENLFSWSRSQLNEIKVRASLTDISTIIHQVLKYINSMAEAKDLKISYSSTENVFGFFDPDMVSIVIRNIVTNAIKFTERGGTILITAVEKEYSIEVFVSDNGIGIPHEKLVSLFNENYPQSTYGTEREKGSGFGLLLCKEFVKLNNGEIDVTSELNKGTEVRIVLPKSH